MNESTLILLISIGLVNSLISKIVVYSYRRWLIKYVTQIPKSKRKTILKINADFEKVISEHSLSKVIKQLPRKQN